MSLLGPDAHAFDHYGQCEQWREHDPHVWTGKVPGIRGLAPERSGQLFCQGVTPLAEQVSRQRIEMGLDP